MSIVSGFFNNVYKYISSNNRDNTMVEGVKYKMLICTDIAHGYYFYIDEIYIDGIIINRGENGKKLYVFEHDKPREDSDNNSNITMKKTDVERFKQYIKLNNELKEHLKPYDLKSSSCY